MEATAIATELDGRPGRYGGFEERKEVLLPCISLGAHQNGIWYLNKGLFSSATRKREVLFSYHGLRGRGA
jgi:hypothetical protein